MRNPSAEELRELASDFDMDVDDEEVDAVRDRVGSLLDDLDDVYDVALPSDAGEPGAHSWTHADDPYNAVSTYCEVPPTEDSSELLNGVDVGLKDIIAVAGIPMECASPIMQGFVPSFDAAVVERLRGAGATIAAKTNLDEMAASPWGNSFDGPVRNPHDKDRTAGGSSGGSAAAVVIDAVDVALGTDTGGSVRIPAAFCGAVGLKPTYGLVPLHGVVENTYTQDHVGPITTSVEDAARVLEAIAGPEDRDPASLAAAGCDSYDVGGYVDAVENPPALESVTIGRVSDGFGDGVNDDVEERVRCAIDKLEDAGASVVDVAIENYDAVGAVKNALSVTELAAHWSHAGAPVRRGGVVDDGYQTAFHARAAARSGELGVHYKGKVLAGARLLDVHGGRHYTRAQAARDVLAEEVESKFADLDVLAMPTMPDVAPPISDAEDPGFNYGRNVRLADVTRLPAITLPNGTIDGLPVGFQLMAPEFGDAELLGVADRVETVLS